jgi:hypothetical protein
MFANSDFTRLGVKKLMGVALFNDNFATASVILKGVGGERTRCVLQNLRYFKDYLLRSFSTVRFAPVPPARLSDLSSVAHFTLLLTSELECCYLENDTNDSNLTCSACSFKGR